MQACVRIFISQPANARVNGGFFERELESSSCLGLGLAGNRDLTVDSQAAYRKGSPSHLSSCSLELACVEAIGGFTFSSSHCQDVNSSEAYERNVFGLSSGEDLTENVRDKNSSPLIPLKQPPSSSHSWDHCNKETFVGPKTWIVAASPFLVPGNGESFSRNSDVTYAA